MSDQRVTLVFKNGDQDLIQGVKKVHIANWALIIELHNEETLIINEDKIERAEVSPDDHRHRTYRKRVPAPPKPDLNTDKLS